jgi:hypothetical protein
MIAMPIAICINMRPFRYGTSSRHPCIFHFSLSRGNLVGRYSAVKAVEVGEVEEEDAVVVEVVVVEVEVNLEAYPRDHSTSLGPSNHPYPLLPEGRPSGLSPLDPEEEKNTLFLLNTHLLDVKLEEVHGLKCTVLRMSK